MSLITETQDLLTNDSKLKRLITDFEVRSSQLEMSLEVAKSIEEKSVLLAEAGTGTGKTFAYLIPALLSGKKVIISTATKNLQEQLLSKDIPLIKQLCGFKGSVKLLKGRENYLCPQRLEIAETTEQNTRSVWQKLSLIHDWMEKTHAGDKAELNTLDENDPIWHKVCARLEFCQANGCHADSDCFYPKVKQDAVESDVLIVNHHLFCADLALRENGFGELLPEADVYIFDEAHQLPDIAAQFLGFTLSRGQFDELARDMRNAVVQEAKESADMLDAAKQLELSVQQFNEVLGKWEKRWNWEAFSAHPKSIESLDAILDCLKKIEDGLKPFLDRGKSIAAVQKRAQDMADQLRRWLTSSSQNEVRWVDSSQARFRLNFTPMSVSEPFSKQRDILGGAWIFTSATLSVNGQFDYFSRRLGLEEGRALQWDSPFDYLKQGLIYHPVGLPDPKSPDYIKICLRAIWPLLQASEGNAFLLFTSHRALMEANSILKDHWDGNLFVQGDAPKHDLLLQFRKSERSILLGTSSFWEGVDVKGGDLKLVMIDRIPFIPPDDPVVQARETALKQQGLNAFYAFQIPEAIIALKQGTGRLIRSTEDKGVLVLCDPRIMTKPYGKAIINSLPRFRWVYEPTEAKQLLNGMSERTND